MAWRMRAGRAARLAGLVVAATAVASAAQADRPSAADLAARVQARYDTIRDFTADFTQRQTSPLLPKPVVERGTVEVKKPGRMRWVYTTGDRNQLVSDGTMIYAYFPQDRHVSPTPMPKEDEAATGLLFLTGRGHLTRDFTARMADDQPASEWRLDLRPRTPNAEFDRLTLEVDRATLALRGLEILDPQGAISAFRFTNLRENTGLPDSHFVFTVPRGVEVR